MTSSIFAVAGAYLKMFLPKVLKALFARYGVPDLQVTDNGQQFASAELKVFFAKRWGFQHLISSPHYPESNGRVENAVKTVK